jgi:hypothetical protein
MKASRVFDNKKKIGRPRTGVGALVGQRWHEEQLAQIDRWRRAQADMPTRSEAIRRLVEIGLLTSTTTPDMRYQAKASDSAAKAKKLAGELGLKAKGK